MLVSVIAELGIGKVRILSVKLQFELKKLNS